VFVGAAIVAVAGGGEGVTGEGITSWCSTSVSTGVGEDRAESSGCMIGQMIPPPSSSKAVTNPKTTKLTGMSGPTDVDASGGVVLSAPLALEFNKDCFKAASNSGLG
jgi:hypothetical protein